jgi:hypothetical protein
MIGLEFEMCPTVILQDQRLMHYRTLSMLTADGGNYALATSGSQWLVQLAIKSDTELSPDQALVESGEQWPGLRPIVERVGVLAMVDLPR